VDRINLMKGTHWELVLKLKSEHNIKKDVMGNTQTVERIVWDIDADFDKLEKIFKKMEPNMAEFLLSSLIGILETIKQSAVDLVFEIKHPHEYEDE